MLIEKAKLIARIAHRGQTRWQGEPYFVHPERVAKFARVMGFPEHAVAAGYLHDVIEDCEITADELRTLLGDSPSALLTVNLVVEVTNVAKPSDGNRAKRMAINRDHLAQSTMWGASLKCLDIHDNLSCPYDDPVWAAKYFGEKNLELAILKHADPNAWSLAYNTYMTGPTLVPKSDMP